MTGFEQDRVDAKEARKISDTEEQAFQGITYEADGEREKTIDDLLHRTGWLQGSRWSTIAIAVAVAVAIMFFGGIFIVLALVGAVLSLIRRLFR